MNLGDEIGHRNPKIFFGETELPLPLVSVDTTDLARSSRLRDCKGALFGKERLGGYLISRCVVEESFRRWVITGPVRASGASAESESRSRTGSAFRIDGEFPLLIKSAAFELGGRGRLVDDADGFASCLGGAAGKPPKLSGESGILLAFPKEPAHRGH